MLFNKEGIVSIARSTISILKHAIRFDAAKGDAMFCETLQSTSPLEHRLGVEKTKTEIRVAGGLLLTLGMACIISAMPTTDSHLMGNVGVEQVAGLKLATVFASCYQILMGVGAICFGVPFLVAAPFRKRAYVLTKCMVFANTLHVFGLVITCVVLLQHGRKALDGTTDEDTTEPSFITTLTFTNGTTVVADDAPLLYKVIPQELSPTMVDIRFVVALGICNFFAICYPLVSGLKLAYTHVLAHMAGRAVNKHRGALLFHCFIYNVLCPFLSGFSQLTMGIFLHTQFGVGPYERPVQIAFLTIYMPSITYIIGFLQICWAIVGLLRFREVKEKHQKPLNEVEIDLEHNDAPLQYSDNSYLVWTCAVWILTIALQVIVQTVWSQGNDSSLADGPVYASAGLGLFLIPAWLDYKVRTTASRINRREFGLPEETECEDGSLLKRFGLAEAYNEDDTSVQFRTDGDSICESVYIEEDGESTDGSTDNSVIESDSESFSESVWSICGIFRFEI